MSKTKKILQTTSTRRGTSLLIAMGLITVLLLISIGITSVVVTAIRDSSNINRSNQAFYAAEGALEAGLLANQAVGAGYTEPSQAVSFSGNNPNLHGSYKIQGQVPSTTRYISDNNYGIPIPGTGTAGKNCDSLNPYISENFHYPSDDPNAVYTAQDHPCNWNKISTNETVSIPLYVTTTDPASSCPEDPDNPGSGLKICNPADLGLNTLKIKVRTPCSNGEIMCAPIERYNLDNMNGDTDFAGDETILNWQILGKSFTGDINYSLSPILGLHFSNNRNTFDTQIYESLINKAKNAQNAAPLCTDIYCVFSQDRKGQDSNKQSDTILNFLKNGNGNVASPFYRSGGEVILKPVLKISIVHSLEDVSDNTIPYLEYQIITNTTLSPSNYAQIVTAEGFSGNFKQVLEVKRPQEAGILQYVIQQ